MLSRMPNKKQLAESKGRSASTEEGCLIAKTGKGSKFLAGRGRLRRGVLGACDADRSICSVPCREQINYHASKATGTAIEGAFTKGFKPL